MQDINTDYKNRWSHQFPHVSLAQGESLKRYIVRFTCGVYYDHYENLVINQQFETLEEAEKLAEEIQTIIRKHNERALKAGKTNERCLSCGSGWLKHKYDEDGHLVRLHGIFEVTETRIK